jgi:hypothetical protein
MTAQAQAQDDAATAAKPPRRGYTGARRGYTGARRGQSGARRGDSAAVRLSQRDIDGLLVTGEHHGFRTTCSPQRCGSTRKRLARITARWRSAGYVATGRLGPGRAGAR